MPANGRFLAALTTAGLVVGGGVALGSVPDTHAPAPVAKSTDTTSQEVQALLARSAALHAALLQAQAARQQAVAAQSQSGSPADVTSQPSGSVSTAAGAGGSAVTSPTTPAPTLAAPRPHGEEQGDDDQPAVAPTAGGGPTSTGEVRHGSRHGDD